jgi:hypothetical protein
MKPDEWRLVRYATGLSSAWIVLYAVRQVDLLMTALLVSTYLGLMTYGLVVPRVRRKLKDRRQQAIRTRAAATLFDWDDLGSTERVRIKLQAGLLTLNDARERVAEIKAAQGYGPSVVTPVQKSEPLPVIGSGSMEQFGQNVQALQDALAPPQPEYVPDGQVELSTALFDALYEQHRDRDRDIIVYHWEMNPEWAAEVRKLRGRDGRQLWTQRQPITPPGPPGEYLWGYPVKVSDAYGAPNLVAS